MNIVTGERVCGKKALHLLNDGKILFRGRHLLALYIKKVNDKYLCKCELFRFKKTGYSEDKKDANIYISEDQIMLYLNQGRSNKQLRFEVLN